MKVHLTIEIFFHFNNLRLIAIGALLSTVTACALIMIQALLDNSHFEKFDYSHYTFESQLNLADSGNDAHNISTEHKFNCTSRKQWFLEHNENLTENNYGHEYRACDVNHPDATVSGTFKAFASIMFAFAGASTFPTIQADMKQKEKFNMAAYIACISEYYNIH